MASPEQISAWICQAEADLAAARIEAKGIAECHRRYWLQQAYEKSIKAFALMRWKGPPSDEREFARAFLLQHSPLASMATPKTPLSRTLDLLKREIDTFVHGLDGSPLLKKLDATTPTTDPGEVSYRYPFRRDDTYVPPAEYLDWDGYQGNHDGVRAAIERLIKAVKREFRTCARTPK